MLVILIANAVKFTLEGEVVVRVAAVIETADGRVVPVEVPRRYRDRTGHIERLFSVCAGRRLRPTVNSGAPASGWPSRGGWST